MAGFGSDVDAKLTCCLTKKGPGLCSKPLLVVDDYDILRLGDSMGIILIRDSMGVILAKNPDVE